MRYSQKKKDGFGRLITAGFRVKKNRIKKCRDRAVTNTQTLKKSDRRIQWYLCLENMKHSPVRRRAGHFLIFRKVSRSFFDAVAERTSHIVAVIMSGRPLDIRKIAEKVPGCPPCLETGNDGSRGCRPSGVRRRDAFR